MLDLIVFPSSYFNNKYVDEEFLEEYESVKNTGLFSLALFGYNEWYSKQKLSLDKAIEKNTRAVYRGWMMKPEEYALFYHVLLDKNIELITTPEQYERMHLFPNVYKYLENDTAKMKIYPFNQKLDVNELKTYFGRFMIKDFVKSVKGTEFPSFFDESVSQYEFDRCMEDFFKYRGEMITGGICVKEYLSLKHYEGKTNEYRVFYINHQVATVTKNSNQSNDTNEVPRDLIEKYSDLDSLYYTVDYAELTDGEWKIIEAGDGGVSGIPYVQDKENYYKILYDCFNSR